MEAVKSNTCSTPNGVLHMHCTCTAHALHMYCTCTAHVLHMHCTCTAHALHMYCTCTAHALHMYCTCTALALHMYCTCTAHALHMYCTCTAHVLHMYCTCTSRCLVLCVFVGVVLVCLHVHVYGFMGFTFLLPLFSWRAIHDFMYYTCMCTCTVHVHPALNTDRASRSAVSPMSCGRHGPSAQGETNVLYRLL